MRAWTTGILAAILAAATAAGGEGPNDDDPFRKAMRDGIKILRDGDPADFPGAAARFRTALNYQSEDANVYFWLGLAYSDFQDPIRATAPAKEAATMYDPKMANAWLLWGQALLYRGEYADALEKLKEAERLAPEDPLVLFNLGRVLYHGFSDYAGAYYQFNQVWTRYSGSRQTRPELFPVVVQARLYMAYCNEELRKWDDAIRYYKEVRDTYMEYLPGGAGNLDLRARLAATLRLAGRPTESLSAYQDLLARLRSLPADEAREKLLADVRFRLGHLYLTEDG